MYFIYHRIWYWFFFFNSSVTIAQIDDDLIASEIHGSVSRNCVELNEFSNDGKNNNTCGEKIIDWNECPIDETEVIEECEDINSIENGFEPFVGQCFLSEEEAFNFYKNYANQCGFTIWKGRSEKKNGEIARRDFFCHREGRQPLKIVNPSKEQRNRKSLKCGCKAHLTIVLRKSIDIIPRKWHVTMFVVDHNHELLSPLGVWFLPANRVITEDYKNCILLYKEARPSVREIIHVMELKKNVKCEHLPFFSTGYS